ncbi:hypothetical protein [Algoriphagus sp. AK58]|uniref:hypothetical protein n=1 Tax=Algoriphagus sp. AK58 TaxID=1406877 RepID=UPI00164F7683|nr:hypothetical protein [Algoriphagus sp. AK58]MBC6366097.1 hypothetical protein [Algoriphagus sp. AK58]
MKTNFLILLFFSLFLFSCSLNSEEDPLNVYREIAYNSLNSTEKATVIGDWKNAEVSAWLDGNYLVVFQTTDAATRGPIRVVVDPDTGRVVEKLPR